MHIYAPPALRRVLTALLLLIFLAAPSLCQTEAARVSGRITDPTGAVVPAASVTVTNLATNVSVASTSNDEGIYAFPSLAPGRYRMRVQRQGFREVVLDGLVLNVQAIVEQNFSLDIGSTAESVTVVADAVQLQASGAVGTVVDRQLVANIPLNGRSFNTLVQLTPGVVLAQTDWSSQGQYSVNGQRTDSNYYMVDGVSANIGVKGGFSLGQEAAGTQPALTAGGGTNTLVSVDALQEFRIQTSTFAPEYGRVPGAQISLLTRSGTNDYHGNLFEYFRNDALDAADWFVNYSGAKKPALRHNNFGGTFGGPIKKDQAFFFFSYEGARLLRPQAESVAVPSKEVRAAATGAIKSVFNAFPVPNGADLGSGFAEFTGSYSEPSNLNTSSLRLDYTPSSKLTLFGRYSLATSDQITRGMDNLTLSTFTPMDLKTQTVTFGATWNLSSKVVNDLRLNWSQSNAGSRMDADNFGGAVPVADSLLFPPSVSAANGYVNLMFMTSGWPGWSYGANVANHTRQINLVNTIAFTRGAHQFKIGLDYRRLSPFFGPREYSLDTYFSDPLAALNGVSAFGYIMRTDPIGLIYNNISIFGQDTWSVTPRLSLTYGLRWEVNPPPHGAGGKALYTVTTVDEPAKMALAPAGTALYATTYKNIAPRIGLSYRLNDSKGWQSVLRGGFGYFYDLGSSRTDLAILFPWAGMKDVPPSPYPLDPAAAAAPSFSIATPIGNIGVNDPNLKLPRTYQWNVALEQSLGGDQSVTLAYVGAVGRRLLKYQYLLSPNADFGSVQVVRNAATSDYHAMQAQFNRRMAKRVQGLLSYTWAHSLDTASDDSLEMSNPARGPSAFDVRHSLSSALTYELPAPTRNAVLQGVLGNWNVDGLVQARSAPPVNIVASSYAVMAGAFENVRPDVVPGVPFYRDDRTVPGGRVINKAAFVAPPAGRQGMLGRNALRGFGAYQVDLGVRREFAVRDRMKLQVRADFFNIFNHPNFGSPSGTLSSGQFGRATRTLAASLGSGGINGGFNPLFQIGGPRSIQLALKLIF